MNTQEILRQLTNSGIRVIGTSTDASTIYIEDPSCILRGFETFMDYAWWIISVITGILLFGWAMALIRGSKNNIFTNVRNLLIMFGTLAAVRPIAGLIWGGDVFGRGCRHIGVSTEAVAKILTERDKHLRDTDKLYEVFDIYDTGELDEISLASDDEEITITETTDTADDAPTPRTNEKPSSRASETTPPASDTPVTGGSPNHTSGGAVSATADGNDVIYTHGDSRRVRYTGGTRAWRNTNPGNIRYSEFTRRHGAIGTAGNFAVFPNEEIGTAAITALLQSDKYRNLTIADAISRYAPPSENDTAAYKRQLAKMTGLSVDRRISDLTDAELRNVANAIRRIEGWEVGQKIEL